MAFDTALDFVLIGGSLLYLDRRTRRGLWVSQYLALAVLVLSVLAFAGYIYGVANLYGNTSYIPIASMTFVVLSAGVLCARPERGLMAVVTSRNVGGVVARRLLPACHPGPAGARLVQAQGTTDRALRHRARGVPHHRGEHVRRRRPGVVERPPALPNRRRAQTGRRGDAGGEGEGRGGQQGQERVPGEHEPRDPHPHERRYRHDRPPSGHPPRRGATRVRGDGALLGPDLLAILNDILDFSKIEAGSLSLETINFELRREVEEVAALLAGHAHEKGLELVSFVEPGTPTAVRGDPFRLRQVLTNILGNAIKFTEEGEVTLRAELLEDAPDTATVCFEVSDTGIGMTEEQRSGSSNPLPRPTPRPPAATGARGSVWPSASNWC